MNQTSSLDAHEKFKNTILSEKREVLSGETVFQEIGLVFRTIGPGVSPTGTFSKTQHS